jgi:hypothetical protein
MREERRLRVFESRVLRRIFDCKRGQVIRSGTDKEELNDLHSSPNFIRVMK